MTLWWILAVVAAAYIIYAILPELFGKVLHIGTFYRGLQSMRTVALTFDDGPDPRYTPQVLDILRAHGAKATFFLVGERALEHPEIVRIMMADGHEIASHSFRHRHAWLRNPVSTWLDIRKSRRVLSDITGKRVQFYRPPWGAFNLVTRIACTAFRLQPVLWNMRAIDWNAGDHVQAIIRRVVNPAQPGSIVLCHDAGGAEGAPLNTVAALPVILDQLGRLGFELTTVGQLYHGVKNQTREERRPYANYPMLRRMLIHVWSIVEWAFSRTYHVVAVDQMFRISKATWHFGARMAPDSDKVMLQDGDSALDLHFQNQTLISISRENNNKSLVRALKQVKVGLGHVAQILAYHPDYQDVKTLAAVTLMNRGLELLGFHVEEVQESKEGRRLQRYMRFLMGMYHPDGFRRLNEGSHELTLKLVWMTREELLNRYLPKPTSKEA